MSPSPSQPHPTPCHRAAALADGGSPATPSSPARGPPCPHLPIGVGAGCKEPLRWAGQLQEAFEQLQPHAPITARHQDAAGARPLHAAMAWAGQPPPHHWEIKPVIIGAVLVTMSKPRAGSRNVTLRWDPTPHRSSCCNRPATLLGSTIGGPRPLQSS